MLPKRFSRSARVMIVCFVLGLMSFSIWALGDLSAQSLTDRANMRAQTVHAGILQNEPGSVDQRRDLRQTPSSPGTPDAGRIYTPADLAYYLDASQVSFIRPGLKFTIQKVTIGDDRKIQVTFLITDNLGLPLDRLGVYTPGPVSTSFVAAYIPQGAAQYVAYTTRVQTSPITGVSATQAGTDSGGTYAQVGDGTYTYTFKTVLPAGYDQTVTHTVSVYGSRDLSQFDLGIQYDNKMYSWVPNGSPVRVVRDVVTTNTCNSRCHDPLALHGGSRREIGLCVLCHTPQTTDPDTGNTVDLGVMVHKIHYAPNLPSVKAGNPYRIIGFGQSVNDYSDVTYPYDMRACTHCHDGSGKQSNNYMTRPTAAACGSCHDDINFQTGENHPAGAQTDDKCASCHIPEGDKEWDASIKGAHTIPTMSKQLPGVVFTLNSVTNTKPGQNPVVSFSIKDKSGFPIEAKQMNSLSLVLAGPNTDYSFYARENLTVATTPSTGGNVTYTFKAVVPADATGSYTVWIQGYRNITLDPAPEGVVTARDIGYNQSMAVAVTDSDPVPRRQIVTTQKCDSCHGVISVHGGSRPEVQYCSVCHNPTATAANADPTLPAQAIHFKLMIHKIHTGEELSNDYIIGDTSFNEVTFPGDRRNCQKCHIAGTEQIVFPKGVLSTVSPQTPINPMPPATAACLSCHDFQEAAAHASLNSSPTLGESCRVCHGPNSEYSVSRVHAR